MTTGDLPQFFAMRTYFGRSRMMGLLRFLRLVRPNRPPSPKDTVIFLGADGLYEFNGVTYKKLGDDCTDSQT